MSRLTDELNARGQAQVIVVLKDPQRGARTLESGSTSGGTDITRGEMSAHFVRPMRGAALAAACGEAPPEPGVRYYPNLNIALGTVTKTGLAGLKAEKTRVREVLPVPLLRPIRPVRTAHSKAPTADVTWGLKRMRVHRLWELGFTGEGILIGHLDTGADAKHAALREAIHAFAYFDMMGRSDPKAGAARDSDKATPGHGTHTAAIIAGRAVGGRHVGVAPGARLATATVIEGGDTIARILGGMDWAVGLGVRILNMSLGLPGWDDSFLPLTQILRARGILPIFAVGNEGPGTSRSPGNYAEALSVGAATRGQSVADFSSSDQFLRPVDRTVPNVVAPGVDIVSARPGGGYQLMSGTSMAAPHVAGLAALILQAVPSAGIELIEASIFESCRPLPDALPVRQGRGMIDALRAMEALLRLTGQPMPVLRVRRFKSGRKSSKTPRGKTRNQPKSS